jgi:phosphatidylinositol alpha-mannosyltransferase
VRIALVCPYAWEDPGGVQVHVRELGEKLRERGHEVLGLTPSRGRPASSWVRGVGPPANIPYNGSNAPISPWPGTYRNVRMQLRAFRPDVVHVHEPLTPSASMFAVLAGVAPSVATFHSGADWSRLFDLAAPGLKRVARRLAVRVAVSERAASFVRTRIGGTYRVIPNGADVTRFEKVEPADLGPDGPRILFVGRLHERKGFPTLVSAFGILAGERDDVRLVVAGEGEDRTAIDRLAPSARARVTMLGMIPNEDLPPYHTACDVFVAPSVGGESFGMILVEAMAAGLPVIASDIPGYDEVIADGIDGLLVPPRAPVSLADTIGRVLDDAALSARLGEAARQRARRFDWSVVTEELEEAYRDALAMGRAPLR